MLAEEIVPGTACHVVVSFLVLTLTRSLPLLDKNPTRINAVISILGRCRIDWVAWERRSIIFSHGNDTVNCI